MIGIFLDIETTGLDSLVHRVLEIAFKFIDLNTGELLISFISKVLQGQDVWDRSDKKSLLVNGFSQQEFQDAVSEKDVAFSIKDIFKRFDIKRGKAVFICQNPSFDRSFFSQLVSTYEQEQEQWPYHWLDFASMYWALRIKSSQQEPKILDNIHLSKDKIAHLHGLPPEQHPHRAMNGVDHLILCYATVVGYPRAREFV